MSRFRSAAILLLLSALALWPYGKPSSGDETGSSPSVSAFLPSGEVGKLARLLLEGDAGDSDTRFRLDSDDSRLQAMLRLSQIASPDAVEVLYRFLIRPDAGRELKACAVVALGQARTEQAVAALSRFEQWAEWRRTVPGPFSFGEHEFAIYHFAPATLEPTYTRQAPDGRWWALFQWDKFGLRDEEGPRPDWWVTSSTDRRLWEQPILVTDAEESAWFVRVAEDPSLLSPFTRDSDEDGLPDLVESRLGTDPQSPDSDRDGVDDGSDGNPLTPAGQAAGDEAEIRQAVFSILFATCDGEHPIYLLEKGDFARQEYRGYQGPVLPSPTTKLGRVNITDIDVQVDSPTSAAATINDYEGPLGGSYHRAVLEKLHGKWVVVDFRMLGMS